MKWLFKLLLLVLAIVSAMVLWQRSSLEMLALTRIDPVPDTRQLIAESHYAEAADYLGFFMPYDYARENPDAQRLHRQIETIRDSARYQGDKILEGLPCKNFRHSCSSNPPSSRCWSNRRGQRSVILPRQATCIRSIFWQKLGSPGFQGVSKYLSKQLVNLNFCRTRKSKMRLSAKIVTF